MTRSKPRRSGFRAKNVPTGGGYYNHWELNGKKISNGQRAIALWPDGSTTAGRFVVEKWEHQGCGGMDESYGGENLSFRGDIHGAKIQVRVQDGGLKFVDLEFDDA